MNMPMRTRLFTGNWSWLNYIHLVLLPLLIGLNIIILNTVLANQHQELQVIQSQKRSQSDTDRIIKNTNNDILCVLAFFGQQVSDRTSIYIADISTCTIANTRTGETKTLPLTPVNMPPKAKAQ